MTEIIRFCGRSSEDSHLIKVLIRSNSANIKRYSAIVVSTFVNKSVYHTILFSNSILNDVELVVNIV